MFHTKHAHFPTSNTNNIGGGNNTTNNRTNRKNRATTATTTLTPPTVTPTPTTIPTVFSAKGSNSNSNSSHGPTTRLCINNIPIHFNESDIRNYIQETIQKLRRPQQQQQQQQFAQQPNVSSLIQITDYGISGLRISKQILILLRN
jgi:hypothetical protein